MDRIGRSKFSAISSDSTGNTKLAREMVAGEVPTVIILPDVCHLIANTGKDIGKLDFFDVVRKMPSLSRQRLTYC